MDNQAVSRNLAAKTSDVASSQLQDDASNQQLANFFPSDPLNRRIYTDAEIQNIASLLAPIRWEWSQVPRLYIVLRTINQLKLLNDLLAVGFNDDWFPVTTRTLPPNISPSIRTDIVAVQEIILTKSIDLEKGENGRHRHFGRNDLLPFVSKQVLGTGGYSQVDLVVSQISHREYARKRIVRRKMFGNATREAMARFKTEVDIMKRMKHEHIVECVGSYTDPRYLGILMTPVADRNLEQYLNIEPYPPLQMAELRTYFGCLATALQYLHDNNVRHKDIKPSNVLIKDGRVLLTDFGLSHDTSFSGMGSTTSGATALTPRYCAPEVAEYTKRNSSSDIWSLGCVFLEMVAVLKGWRLKDFYEYFRREGNAKAFIRDNPAATQQLIAQLQTVGQYYDSKPLGWIVDMLREDRMQRPSSAELVSWIVDHSTSPEAVSFCGICCLQFEETDLTDELEDELEANASGPTKVKPFERKSSDVTETTHVIQHTWSGANPPSTQQSEEVQGKRQHTPSTPDNLHHHTKVLKSSQENQDTETAVLPAEHSHTLSTVQKYSEENVSFSIDIPLSDQKGDCSESQDGLSNITTAVLHNENTTQETVSWLETHGVMLDDTSQESLTKVLHLGALHSHEEAVRLALAKGAEVNHIDSSGHTALEYALNTKNPRIVMLLLNYGANYQLPDRSASAPMVDHPRNHSLSISTESGAPICLTDASNELVGSSDEGIRPQSHSGLVKFNEGVSGNPPRPPEAKTTPSNPGSNHHAVSSLLENTLPANKHLPHSSDTTPLPEPTPELAQNYTTLLADHNVLDQKYKRVKISYFELRKEADLLQNLIKKEKLPLSKSSLADEEFINRLLRLEGCIAQVSFSIRRYWSDLPSWLHNCIGSSVTKIGRRGMSAVGRAFISSWLQNQVFDKYFHPDIEPTLASHLQRIANSLPTLGFPTKLNAVDEESTKRIIIGWRTSTLEGISPILKSAEGLRNRRRLIGHLKDQLLAALTTYLQPSTADDWDSDVKCGTEMIIELSVNILSHLNCISRSVRTVYYPPGYPFLADMMDPFLSNGTPIHPDGSVLTTPPSTNNSIIRFATGFTFLSDDKVLKKASVYII